ncbi:thiol peroxidase [uncultured archaeon]|nr:thiol peroxidase [uncultured archaeon]
MAYERKEAVIFGGHPMTQVGPHLQVGDPAPDFEATNSDLKAVRFSSIHAPVKIVSSVPSLDTGVCSAQTKRFEEEIAKMEGKVALITVSMDLPFAQYRFCGKAPPANAHFLSDHQHAYFGKAWGTFIKEVRLLGRAVFVVDSNGRLVHVEYVKETGTHPNYEAVMKAVKEAL